MAESTKKNCCSQEIHPDYSGQMPSLNRVAGQVEGVKRMIEERRYCPDILTQLRALRSAVNSIEANILETHLDSCVTDAFNAGDGEEKARKMAELKKLYRRFNE